MKYVFTILTLLFLASFTLKGDKAAIKWMSFEQMLEASKKEKRKVFIDVYTDWCGWCKKMDATTFSNERVANYANKKFYAVKLDAESMRTLQFRGYTLSERQLAGQVFQVSGYPTTIYLDENLDVLTSLATYLDAPTFEKILKFYGDDNYKKMAWNEFDATYKP